MSTISAVLLLLLQAIAQEPRGGVVTGQIRGADGMPAAGITVILTPDPNGPRPRPVVPANAVVLASETNAMGIYRISYVPEGRYFVHATPDGQFSTFFPGVIGIAAARLVDVGNKATVDNVNFSLAQSTGVRVAGRVRGVPPGMPRGSVIVLLRNPALQGSPVRLAASADGTFEFPNVPAGSYTLGVVPNSYCGNPATPVEVRNQDVAGIELQPAPLLFGRFVVEGGVRLPVEGGGSGSILSPNGRAYAGLAVFGDGEGCPQRGTFAHLLANVQSDGVFVASLAVGDYKVGPQTLPIGYSVKSITYGGQPLQGSLKITRDLTSEVLVTLSPPAAGFRITGKLSGVPAGQTAGVLWINLQHNVPSPISSGGMIEVLDVPLQTDGTFEFRNIPPGTYKMQARPLADPPEGAQYIMSGSINVVVADRDVAGIELPRAITGGVP